MKNTDKLKLSLDNIPDIVSINPEDVSSGSKSRIDSRIAPMVEEPEDRGAKRRYLYFNNMSGSFNNRGINETFYNIDNCAEANHSSGGDRKISDRLIYAINTMNASANVNETSFIMDLMDFKDLINRTVPSMEGGSNVQTKLFSLQDIMLLFSTPQAGVSQEPIPSGPTNYFFTRSSSTSSYSFTIRQSGYLVNINGQSMPEYGGRDSDLFASLTLWLLYNKTDNEVYPYVIRIGNKSGCKENTDLARIYKSYRHINLNANSETFLTLDFGKTIDLSVEVFGVNEKIQQPMHNNIRIKDTIAPDLRFALENVSLKSLLRKNTYPPTTGTDSSMSPLYPPIFGSTIIFPTIPATTSIGTTGVATSIGVSNRHLYEHHANNSLLYVKLDEIIKEADKDKCIHISMDAKLSSKQQEEVTPTHLGDIKGKLYRPVDNKVVWWIKNKSIKEYLEESYFNVHIMLTGNETVTLYERYWDMSSISSGSFNNNVQNEISRLLGYTDRCVGDGNTLCALAGSDMNAVTNYYFNYQNSGINSYQFSVNDEISAGYYQLPGGNEKLFTVYNHSTGQYLISGVSSSYTNEGYQFYRRNYDSMILAGRLSISVNGITDFVLGFGLDNRVTINQSEYSDTPLLLGFSNIYGTRNVSKNTSSYEVENTNKLKIVADNSPSVVMYNPNENSRTIQPRKDDTAWTTLLPEWGSTINGNSFGTTRPPATMGTTMPTKDPVTTIVRDPITTIATLASTRVPVTTIATVIGTTRPPVGIRGTAFAIGSGDPDCLLSINNKNNESMTLRTDKIIIKSRLFRTSNNISDLDRPISYIFNASLTKSRSYEMENNENIKLFANSMPNIIMYNPSENSRTIQPRKDDTAWTTLLPELGTNGNYFEDTRPLTSIILFPSSTIAAITATAMTSMPITSTNVPTINGPVDIIDMNTINTGETLTSSCYNIFIILSKNKNKMRIIVLDKNSELYEFEMSSIYNLSLLSLIRTGISDNAEVVKQTSDSEKYIKCINILDIKDFVSNDLDNDETKVTLIKNILNNNSR